MKNPASPASIGILEAELSETLKAVSESFEAARGTTRQNDEYGHYRSSMVADAVKLLSVSADIGLAIAKIKGDYNHNINVLRGEIWPPPRNAVAKPETFEEGRPSREAIAEAVANTSGVDPRQVPRPLP